MKSRKKKYQKYNTTYFEIYARNSLQYCYNNSWNKKNFDVTKESPDLQSEDLDIGIEVVRSSSQKEQTINSMFNKFRNQEITYETLENKVNPLGGNIVKIELTDSYKIKYKSKRLNKEQTYETLENKITSLGGSIVKTKAIKLYKGIKITKHKQTEINALYTDLYHFQSYIYKHLKSTMEQEDFYKKLDSLMKNCTNPIDQLIYSISNKTKSKLPNYKKFLQNILYIFTGGALLTKSDIEDFLPLLKNEISKCKIQFDLYFINCMHTIFVVNPDKNRVDEIPIESTILEKLKSESIKESKLLFNG